VMFLFSVMVVSFALGLPSEPFCLAPVIPAHQSLSDCMRLLCPASKIRGIVAGLRAIITKDVQDCGGTRPQSPGHNYRLCSVLEMMSFCTLTSSSANWAL
jgi:hypothetical protein